VTYAHYVHDSATGSDWVIQVTDELSNVVASPNLCRIDLHRRTTMNGNVRQDIDAGFDLKVVQDILVLPLEQELNYIDADAGHPTWSSKLSPSLWTVAARRKAGRYGIFFREEEMANRVAKAMAHAVELLNCAAAAASRSRFSSCLEPNT
jgi:hypothetical protein